jgi:hypothetical protein
VLRGDQITDWKGIPAGTRVVMSAEFRDNPPESARTIGVDGASAQALAGEEYNRHTTIYFLPDGKVLYGNELSEARAAKLPLKTKVLVGYALGGEISARRSAFVLCGTRWNASSTFYRLPDGTVRSGDRIKEGAIPKGTQVFFQE